MTVKRNIAVALATVAASIGVLSGGIGASAKQSSPAPVTTDLGTFAEQGSGSTAGRPRMCS